MDVFLFTNSYPYGKGETFLENEIPILAKEFDKVHIFPWVIEGICRELPRNCVVHKGLFGQTKGLKRILLFNIRVILSIVVRDVFSNENRRALKNIKAYKEDILRFMFEANCLKSFLNEIDSSPGRIYYTYWFYTWTNLLSVIKNPKDKLITRSHGFDFNLERNGNGYFPFRPFTWSQIDVNYNVSNFGANYLRKRYPKRQNKIRVSYLGVKDQEVLSSINGTNVVSCSNIIPLKRVHLIVEVLRSIKTPIH